MHVCRGPAGSKGDDDSQLRTAPLLREASVARQAAYQQGRQFSGPTVITLAQVHCIALTAPHCTELHSLHCIELTALYCTALYCTSFHCIELNLTEVK